MTTAMTTDLELMRTRLSGAIGHHLPGHIERLGWDAGRLAAHQRDRLRALLARAITRSPFHAARLRGVDPDRFELADVARLPAAACHLRACSSGSSAPPPRFIPAGSPPLPRPGRRSA